MNKKNTIMIKISVAFVWQLEAVTFKTVSSSYCQALLASIGGQLLKLEYLLCQDIDLSQLVPCDQLENLNIDLFCSINQSMATPIIQPFLPSLKNLVCKPCLGAISPVFECARVPLKHLLMTCCHLGVSRVTHLNWRDIPDLWPNLETIVFFRAKSLTVDKLRLFVFRMENLKSIKVPHEIMNLEDANEVKLFGELQEELKTKNIILSSSNPSMLPCHCYN